MLVKILTGEHRHHHERDENDPDVEQRSDGPGVAGPHCVGCSNDPVGELNEWQQRAEEELEGAGDANTKTSATVDNPDANSSNASVNDDPGQNEEQGSKVVVENAPTKEELEKKRLSKMGLSTALAIALHNFPEGLATFVAALKDPAVGAVLAIAIGIHNIPEGLCVALPIYYATGNRWKAFLWGCLSGVSEPIAALLGWLILAKTMGEEVYAVLFGLVSGMMVIISLKELIPTAHRYDPEDSVVTYSIIAGMVIIALSLVLFKL